MRDGNTQCVGVDSASRVASATPATGRLAGEEIAGAGVGSGVAGVSAGEARLQGFGSCLGLCRGRSSRNSTGAASCFSGEAATGVGLGASACAGGAAAGTATGTSSGAASGFCFRSRLGGLGPYDIRGNSHGRGYGSGLGLCNGGVSGDRPRASDSGAASASAGAAASASAFTGACIFRCIFGDRLGHRLRAWVCGSAGVYPGVYFRRRLVLLAGARPQAWLQGPPRLLQAEGLPGQAGQAVLLPRHP